MALTTNGFTTYDAKGIREDLSDTIFNISPVETPLVSNVGKRKASNTYFEWQTDALASAVTTNAQLEGGDVTAVAVSPTTRVGNYTQIFLKSFAISGTLEATDRAGRKQEQAYQMAKRTKEIKRDMEATFTSSQVAVAGGTTTARKTACLDSWLVTNTNNGNGGTGDYSYTTTPITARTAATTGTIRTWTETIFKDVIQKTWTAGGEADMVLVSGVNKQRASAFSGIADLRHETGTKDITIIGGADVYRSDFGELTMTPDRFMPADRAYHVDPNYVSLATLRPLFMDELAKTGDAKKYELIIECGLQVDNEGANGVARDITTT